MSMTTHALVLFVLVSATACAHTTTVPEAAPSGPPVATYQLPPAQPKGTLHVVSLGLEALPAGEDGEAMAFLHLRLAAINGSDTVTWTVDPNDQLLAVAGQKVAPQFSEAVVGDQRGPVLSLVPGARGHLDLYYPAPPDVIRDLALSWQVLRGTDAVAAATPLRRVAGPDDDRYAYYQPADDAHITVGLGVGSWWWQDYYFWHHDACWWSYPRSHFHARNPTYHPPTRMAEGGHGGGGWTVAEPRTSFWRDERGYERRAAERQEARGESSTSSWRGTPSESSSLGATSASSPPASSPPASSPPSGGGGSSSDSGKSGWRR
jgi:hypothetical protein